MEIFTHKIFKGGSFISIIVLKCLQLVELPSDYYFCYYPVIALFVQKIALPVHYVSPRLTNSSI